MTRDNIAVAVKLKALPNPGFLTEAAHVSPPPLALHSILWLLHLTARWCVQLYVVNSHIHWDPRFADVKLVQTQILLEEMERITNRDPVIFCADLNSTTESAVYEVISLLALLSLKSAHLLWWQLLEKSLVPPEHTDLQFGYKYGRQCL